MILALKLLMLHYMRAFPSILVVRKCRVPGPILWCSSLIIFSYCQWIRYFNMCLIVRQDIIYLETNLTCMLVTEMQGLCGIRKLGVQGALDLFLLGISRYWNCFIGIFLFLFNVYGMVIFCLFFIFMSWLYFDLILFRKPRVQ